MSLINARFATADLIRSLRSNICPACGKFKRAGQTLCLHDYRRLPAQLAARLYDRVGEGYEQAFDRAMINLGVEQPKFPAEVPHG